MLIEPGILFAHCFKRSGSRLAVCTWNLAFYEGMLALPGSEGLLPEEEMEMTEIRVMVKISI